ncbi:hypothetical protein ACRRTK_023749 [Alexandromys fortis]
MSSHALKFQEFAQSKSEDVFLRIGCTCPGSALWWLLRRRLGDPGPGRLRYGDPTVQMQLPFVALPLLLRLLSVPPPEGHRIFKLLQEAVLLQGALLAVQLPLPSHVTQCPPMPATGSFSWL